MKAAILCAIFVIAAGAWPLGGWAGEANDTARIIAREISPYWNAYEGRIGRALRKWGCRELGRAEGETVFYPFSGPDLPTAVELYPDADRYVLVSMQKAGAPPPLEISRKELENYLAAFRKAASFYGALGFFRTDDLDALASAQSVRIGMTGPLMAFSVRLGFEIETVEPLRLGDEVTPGAGPWDSVRLAVRKGERQVVVDYVHMDLSDAWLKQVPGARKWIDLMAANPTLLKAASHLPQEAGFSILRDSLLGQAPSIVQDETGIDYGALTDAFTVRLYGKFTRSNPSFGGNLQRSLAAAYQRGGARPLPFRIGYEKNSGSALQVAIRKTRSHTASRDCR